MPYVPDPTDTAEPTDAIIAETAAPEFRALKVYLAAGAGRNGRGTLLNVPDVTATTVKYAPDDGIYRIAAWVADTTAANTCYGVFVSNGGTLRQVVTSNGANIALSISGDNIQVSITAGGPLNIKYIWGQDQ